MLNESNPLRTCRDCVNSGRSRRLCSPTSSANPASAACSSTSTTSPPSSRRSGLWFNCQRTFGVDDPRHGHCRGQFSLNYPSRNVAKPSIRWQTGSLDSFTLSVRVNDLRFALFLYPARSAPFFLQKASIFNMMPGFKRSLQIAHNDRRTGMQRGEIGWESRRVAAWAG